MAGLVVGQRFHVQLVCVEKVDVGVRHELNPIAADLGLVGCALLEAEVLIFQILLVNNVPQLKGRIPHLLLLDGKRFLNYGEFFSICWPTEAARANRDTVRLGGRLPSYWDWLVRDC
jgi:hypothetical protein